MAKKKSKRFIIPSAFFLNAVVAKKLDKPAKPIPAPTAVSEPAKTYLADTVKKEEPQKQKPALLQTGAVKLNKSSRRKSALSISSLKRDKIEEAKQKDKKIIVENLDNLPKDPFTEETFLNHWHAYIEELHKDGEKIFASILKADTPKIKNNLICVTYPNEMMKTELNKVKSKALKHLRQKLNNYGINFKIDVNEANTKRFAYTPQEKFEFLKDKNEAIVALKKTFNLEL